MIFAWGTQIRWSVLEACTRLRPAVGTRSVVAVSPARWQCDPAVLRLGAGRLSLTDVDSGQNRRVLTMHICHACPQGQRTFDRNRFHKVQLQRRRAVGKGHWLLDRDPLIPTRGGGRRPKRVTDDRGRDHAALESAGQSDVKWLRLPSAHNVIVFPIALDSKTALVQTSTPVAIPVNGILE